MTEFSKLENLDFGLRRHKVTSIILLALFKSMVRCKERAFDYL
jgi:hypothetical protein